MGFGRPSLGTDRAGSITGRPALHPCLSSPLSWLCPPALRAPTDPQHPRSHLGARRALCPRLHPALPWPAGETWPQNDGTPNRGGGNGKQMGFCGSSKDNGRGNGAHAVATGRGSGLPEPCGVLGNAGDPAAPPPSIPPRPFPHRFAVAPPSTPRRRKLSCPTRGRSAPLGGPRLDGVDSARCCRRLLLSPRSFPRPGAELCRGHPAPTL